jgi:hypothetical protein
VPEEKQPFYYRPFADIARLPLRRPDESKHIIQTLVAAFASMVKGGYGFRRVSRLGFRLILRFDGAG